MLVVDGPNIYYYNANPSGFGIVLEFFIMDVSHPHVSKCKVLCKNN